MRLWSLMAEPAGRTPGVTIKKSAPHASRMRAASCGEATTPSRLADLASFARRTTASLMGNVWPTPAQSSWLMLVSTVMAMSFGHGMPLSSAAACSRSAAVFIIV